MIKFLSLVLVMAVGFQASADDLKIFKKAAIGPIIGKKGYIHCERTMVGDRPALKLVRLGRDGVQRSGDHYVSRADTNIIFVESKFKKSMAENGSAEQVFEDTDFIKNKFWKARDICDDHKALQSGSSLVRNKESNDQPDEQDQPEQPSSPEAPTEPPPGPQGE